MSDKDVEFTFSIYVGLQIAFILYLGRPDARVIQASFLVMAVTLFLFIKLIPGEKS